MDEGSIGVIGLKQIHTANISVINMIFTLKVHNRICCCHRTDVLTYKMIQSIMNDKDDILTYLIHLAYLQMS